MDVIRTEQLTRSYGHRRGVEQIDVRVAGGTIFGFLGPNGAGKTTTIRLLLGFLRAGAGRAEILGYDCWRDGQRIKRDVGYVPGDMRLYPWMTARSGLSIVGRIRGCDVATEGRTLADRFQLEMDVAVRKMSRGTRQKLGLMLALAHRPRVLVLDEPTSGLDPLVQETLADMLRERAAEGATIFFSSHTLREVEELCDRVAIIRSGRLVANESLDDLRRRARRDVTLVFRDEDTAARHEPPASLKLIKRYGRTWRGEIDGVADRLLQWAAARSVEDLTIGPPDLETLFRKFYRDDEASP